MLVGGGTLDAPQMWTEVGSKRAVVGARPYIMFCLLLSFR